MTAKNPILQAAQEAGVRYYFTGKPCKNGHVAQRRVSSRQCVECAAEIDKRWKEKNGARLREMENKRRAEDREKFRAYDRSLYWQNPEKYRAKTLRTIKKSRAHYTAKKAERHAAFLERIPAWADLPAIECVYQEARLASEYFGDRYEVDHIVPLQGKAVSGLHIATNLRIITKSDNCSKSNKF